MIAAALALTFAIGLSVGSMIALLIADKSRGIALPRVTGRVESPQAPRPVAVIRTLVRAVFWFVVLAAITFVPAWAGSLR